MTPPRPLWKSVQDYVLIAIGMISYAIGSVSYTHLEVTEWNQTTEARDDGEEYQWTPHHERHLLWLATVLRIKLIVAPVSYTHLDVYKRQVLYRLPQGSRRSHN